MKSSTEFPLLESHLRASVLARTVRSGASVWQSAVTDASLSRWLRRARGRVAACSASERVRLCAVFAAVAAAGHALLLMWVEPNIAPAIPKLLWWIVAAAAGV